MTDLQQMEKFLTAYDCKELLIAQEGVSTPKDLVSLMGGELETYKEEILVGFGSSERFLSVCNTQEAVELAHKVGWEYIDSLLVEEESDFSYELERERACYARGF
tara:strand:- start:479 stop:793 length:315 start_codon:yes stop_codon:yes gene_type:complete